MPEGKYGVSVMACVSACKELVHGPIQTGDMNGEPGGQQRVNSATALGSCDGSYEVYGAFRARPARARFRDPARKRYTSDMSLPRGRRKYRRVLWEFGTDGSTCERVCEAPRAACHVFCSQNARSAFPGRCACAGLHGKLRRCGVRVMSAVGTSRHELRASCTSWLVWGIPQRRAICRVTSRLHVSPDGRDGRASCRLPPWRCKKINK